MAVEIDNLFFDNIIEQSFFKFYHFLSSLISSILCKLFYLFVWTFYPAGFGYDNAISLSEVMKEITFLAITLIFES